MTFLDATLGSLFIGYSFSLWLYGISLSQIGLFFHNNSRTRSRSQKAIVWSLFILENAQTVVLTEGLWLYLINYRIDLTGITAPPRAFGILVYLTSISNVLVRCVYASRIHKLGGKPIVLPLVIVVLSLLVASLSCVYGTQGVRMINWESRLDLQWIFYTGFACELLADFIITSSLVFVLARKRVGMRSSDYFTQTLLVYFLNSGLLVMICVVCSIVAYIKLPNSFAFLAFYLVLGRLYANSLLGSMNARDVIFAQATWESRKSSDSAPSAGLLTSVVVLDERDMLETTAAELHGRTSGPRGRTSRSHSRTSGSFDSDETRVNERIEHALKEKGVHCVVQERALEEGLPRIQKDYPNSGVEP